MNLYLLMIHYPKDEAQREFLLVIDSNRPARMPDGSRKTGNKTSPWLRYIFRVFHKAGFDTKSFRGDGICTQAETRALLINAGYRITRR